MTNVCPERMLSKAFLDVIERVHEEWLVVVHCDANAACLERVLQKSSV